jgi:hypothetical protein
MYQVLQIDVFGRLDLARVGEEILIGGNVTFSVSTELPSLDNTFYMYKSPEKLFMGVALGHNHRV